MAWIAAAGTAIQALSPLVAKWLSSGDREQAAKLMAEAMDEGAARPALARLKNITAASTPGPATCRSRR